MISGNDEWEKESHEEPAKVPRKRLVTEAMIAASRAKGAKGKGPTSDTGRER